MGLILVLNSSASLAKTLGLQVVSIRQSNSPLAMVESFLVDEFGILR